MTYKNCKLNWKTYWFPYIGLFITWLTVHQLIRFFTRMTLVSEDNVRKAEVKAEELGVGIIFAMNHSNRLLDPFFVTAASTPYYPSFPMFYVTGKMSMYKRYSRGLYKIIYNGFIFKMLGSHYINSGVKDYAKSLESHVKLLQARQSVAIFPEGKLTKDGNLGTARGGIGYLSLETHALVIPVYVNGAWGMSIKDFLLRRGKVSVNYGPYITPRFFKFNERSTRNKYQQYADYIMTKIMALS